MCPIQVCVCQMREITRCSMKTERRHPQALERIEKDILYLGNRSM